MPLKEILLKKFLLACLASLLLAACATPIPASQMMPNKNVYPFLDNPTLNHNVEIGAVSLSPEMPTTGFIVAPVEFKKVLQDSVAQAGWSTTGKAAYSLNANFVEHEVPFSMFNSKVFSIVDYDLKNTATGVSVYHQQVKIPCVVTMAQEFDGVLRQQRALNCSVGENVTHVLRDINSKL